LPAPMSGEPRTITNSGFLSEFFRRHEQMTDRPFCWVLGSGASVQSGIPSGGKLAHQWLAEMHEMEDGGRTPVAQWATAAALNIAGFAYDRAANFYPQLYQRRFRDYPDQGYAFLEKVMDKAEPSFGYSVLAQIMATTHHNVAVTTNFDNLVADALAIYTRTFPLVCGHESLTGYIRPNLRRPLIAKIHRDLLLAPLSNPEEIARLPGEWGMALAKIFSRFTPIVIGYGGNDGSLMNFLLEAEPIPGGIFWCHRHDTQLDERVLAVVERHRGRLVPIAGFDELMLQLQEKLKLPFLLPQLEDIQAKRIREYQRQFEALTAALQKPAESPAAEEARQSVREAADAAVERLTKEKNWWAWELKARAEEDPVKREAIYRAGMEDFPQSAELICNFAVFLEEIEKSDEAETLYHSALAIDPNVAPVLDNLAIFSYRVRGNVVQAERLFDRALVLEPDRVNIHANYAQFLVACGRNDEARVWATTAWALLPFRRSQAGAEVALMRWLLERSADRSGAVPLGHLRDIIDANFERTKWSFDAELKAALPKLPESERPLARKLADAILDESKVATLNDEPLWTSTPPIDPDLP
jgi:Tfp pilus assembly protein PilF